ncbi:ATPase domain-containing protein [Alkalibacter saccharofermentans]|uniref:non-specific serine/threonine protein kinase n=1 Tax=Alkalibacter saccharofermentans DSM 14828 TaxID=1120975 RepID=A0A1M5A3W7_9FIRM|nr:ATPase domain-containing protein [Alkalibacter saccharofermentans]SHF24787.1 circadian clock protein KaiC [Alkalibacter saccharofermentans DSM 14828]
MASNREIQKMPTGISGLDEILQGGYISGNTYLIRGGPGTGKTTAGIHFLYEGACKGEKTLLISLSESLDKLLRDASQKGLDLENTSFLDLTPSANDVSCDASYNVFSPAEVEQPSFMQKITEQLETIKPDRVFVDGITQLQYLSPDIYQFRKQILALIKIATSQIGTVLLSSEDSKSVSDDDLQFMSDGVINLEYINDERGVRVTKFRGSDYKHGFHTMQIMDNGIIIYPRLDPREVKREFIFETISSGIPELDKLLYGGIEKGTATVISGPTGVGKTTLGVQFAKEASERGERTVIYTFEEGKESLLKRMKAVNIPISEMLDQNTLSVVKVNSLEYTPDQFAYLIRNDVEHMNTKIVMIDSISGYLLSFSKGPRDKGEMLRHIHALSEYLKNMGVTMLLLNETHSITGDFTVSEYGISYLADSIVFLRYVELKGELRKVIGVLKKRMSDFEKTLRELEITSSGLKVGRPLSDLRGVLTGNPEFIDDEKNCNY